jgi:hypothetical protein
MSTTAYLSARAKFDAILQLSRDQATAIEANDMVKFNAALAKKGELIASLRDTKHLMASDPSIETVINKVRASEKYSEKLLYERLGMLKRKMIDLQQVKAARGAYKRNTIKLPSFVPTADTPRMFDLRT